MNNKLTESQERLVAAMKREMIEVTQPVLEQVEKLRQEQRELHERGVRDAVNEHEIRYERLRRTVIRIGKSLLSLVDRDEDD